MPEKTDTIDFQIARVDQEIADVEFAEQQAREQGLGLGQFDLQAAGAARKRDRQKEVIKPIEDKQIVTAKEVSAQPQATPEEVEAYKGLQQKLTDALTEKTPAFKDWYERIHSTPSAEERDKLFNEMKGKLDIHLKQDEMKDVLGEGGLKRYNELKSKIMGKEAVEWGKGTRGVKEAVEGGQIPPESFGIKSATHWQGVTPTLEQAKENQAYFKRRQEEMAELRNQ